MLFQARTSLFLALWLLLAPMHLASQSPPESRTPAPTITVQVENFTFDAPETLSAGWATLRLVNNGVESHQLLAIRLRTGRTITELEDSLEITPRLPSWAIPVGGPNATIPGETSESSIRLEEGDYALLCLLASADGEMHVHKGMLRPLSVGPGRSSQPRSDVLVLLREFSITPQQPIVRGPQRLLVTNVGSATHELLLFRMNPGRNASDLQGWLNNPTGEAPGYPVGGSTFLAPQRSALVHLDLSPGIYTLLCLAPEENGAATHLQHGMIRQINIY